MATSMEVLQMLIPNGGYVIHGESFEDIDFIECEPITKSKFESGFVIFDNLKNKKINAKQAARESALVKLAALGLTEEETQALIQ